MIRLATAADVPAVVQLLAEDVLGATRESPGHPAYATAFAAMAQQGGNFLLVAVKHEHVVGCLQLTLIPGLARGGMLRAQIEGVRVATAMRGQGVGESLMQDAINRSRQAGAGLVQLTTDASRANAHRFYERLGFEASHVGMKLLLRHHT